jgi:CubicO group peptidase (beta-lactamase class C family)
MLTVGDLYSHRSGLPDHAGDKLEDLGYDRRFILERLRIRSHRSESLTPTPTSVSPRGRGGRRGAGTSWEDLSEQVLYRPLGMASTSSRFADYEARADKALGHIRTSDGYRPLFRRDADAQSPAE